MAELSPSLVFCLVYLGCWTSALSQSIHVIDFGLEIDEGSGEVSYSERPEPSTAELSSSEQPQITRISSATLSTHALLEHFVSRSVTTSLSSGSATTSFGTPPSTTTPVVSVSKRSTASYGYSPTSSYGNLHTYVISSDPEEISPTVTSTQNQSHVPELSSLSATQTTEFDTTLTLYTATLDLSDVTTLNQSVELSSSSPLANHTEIPSNSAYFDSSVSFTEVFKSASQEFFEISQNSLQSTNIGSTMAISDVLSTDLVPSIMSISGVLSTELVPSTMGTSGVFSTNLVPSAMSTSGVLSSNLVPSTMGTSGVFSTNLVPSTMSTSGVLSTDLVPSTMLNFGPYGLTTVQTDLPTISFELNRSEISVHPSEEISQRETLTSFSFDTEEVVFSATALASISENNLTVFDPAWSNFTPSRPEMSSQSPGLVSLNHSQAMSARTSQLQLTMITPTLSSSFNNMTSAVELDFSSVETSYLTREPSLSSVDLSVLAYTSDVKESLYTPLSHSAGQINSRSSVSDDSVLSINTIGYSTFTSLGVSYQPSDSLKTSFVDPEETSQGKESVHTLINFTTGQTSWQTVMTTEFTLSTPSIEYFTWSSPVTTHQSEYSLQSSTVSVDHDTVYTPPLALPTQQISSRSMLGVSIVPSSTILYSSSTSHHVIFPRTHSLPSSYIFPLASSSVGGFDHTLSLSQTSGDLLSDVSAFSISAIPDLTLTFADTKLHPGPSLTIADLTPSHSPATPGGSSNSILGTVTFTSLFQSSIESSHSYGITARTTTGTSGRAVVDISPTRTLLTDQPTRTSHTSGRPSVMPNSTTPIPVVIALTDVTFVFSFSVDTSCSTLRQFPYSKEFKKTLARFLLYITRLKHQSGNKLRIGEAQCNIKPYLVSVSFYKIDEQSLLQAINSSHTFHGGKQKYFSQPIEIKFSAQSKKFVMKITGFEVRKHVDRGKSKSSLFGLSTAVIATACCLCVVLVFVGACVFFREVYLKRRADCLELSGKPFPMLSFKMKPKTAELTHSSGMYAGEKTGVDNPALSASVYNDIEMTEVHFGDTDEDDDSSYYNPYDVEYSSIGNNFNTDFDAIGTSGNLYGVMNNGFSLSSLDDITEPSTMGDGYYNTKIVGIKTNEEASKPASPPPRNYGLVIGLLGYAKNNVQPHSRQETMQSLNSAGELPHPSQDQAHQMPEATHRDESLELKETIYAVPIKYPRKKPKKRPSLNNMASSRPIPTDRSISKQPQRSRKSPVPPPRRQKQLTSRPEQGQQSAQRVGQVKVACERVQRSVSQETQLTSGQVNRSYVGDEGYDAISGSTQSFHF